MDGSKKPKRYVIPTLLTTEVPPLKPIDLPGTPVKKTPKRIVPSEIDAIDIPPPGMITIEECNRRIAEERRKFMSKDQSPKLSTTFYDKVAELEKEYQDIDEEDDDDDLEKMDMDDAMQIAEDLLDGRFQEKFDRLYQLNEDLEREYEKTPSMKERDKSEEKIEKLLYDITKLQNDLIKIAKKEQQKPTSLKTKNAPRPPSGKNKKDRQGCNRHTTYDACVSDVSGCRFSKKTDKRAAYCAKRRSPRPPKNVPTAQIHPFDPKTMSHLPVTKEVFPAGPQNVPTAQIYPFDPKTMSHLPVTKVFPAGPQKGSKKKTKNISKKKTK